MVLGLKNKLQSVASFLWARLRWSYLKAKLWSAAAFMLTVFRWSVLRTIGASYLSTITILVPFIGYVIFFGNFQGTTFSIDFLSLHQDLTVPQSEAFINIRMTYVGLSIVGFSTIIYKIMCPEAVSAYRSKREYILAMVDVTFSAHALSINENLQERQWFTFAVDRRIKPEVVQLTEVDSTMATTARNKGSARFLERTEWLEANLNALNYIFSRNYEQSDVSLFGVRAVVFAGYATGFIVLLIPSLSVFIPQFISVKNYVAALLGPIFSF